MKPQHKVNCRILLDVVVRQKPVGLKLLSSVYQSHCAKAFICCPFVDRVDHATDCCTCVGFYGAGLSSDGLDKDLNIFFNRQLTIVLERRVSNVQLACRESKCYRPRLENAEIQTFRWTKDACQRKRRIFPPAEAPPQLEPPYFA